MPNPVTLFFIFFPLHYLFVCRFPCLLSFKTKKKHICLSLFRFILDSVHQSFIYNQTATNKKHIQATNILYTLYTTIQVRSTRVLQDKSQIPKCLFVPSLETIVSVPKIFRDLTTGDKNHCPDPVCRLPKFLNYLEPRRL